MRKREIRSKTGVMISYISTPKEREEAKKKLFATLDRIYENYKKTKH